MVDEVFLREATMCISSKAGWFGIVYRSDTATSYHFRKSEPLSDCSRVHTELPCRVLGRPARTQRVGHCAADPT